MTEWIDNKEARALLKCSHSWLTRLSNRGLIKRRRDGRRRWLYNVASLEHYLAHKLPAHRPKAAEDGS